MNYYKIFYEKNKEINYSTEGILWYMSNFYSQTG